MRSWALGVLLASAALAGGVPQADADEAPPSGVVRPKSLGTTRAARRAYDGAPPVRPHDRFTAACTECHTDKRISVPGVGLSPPSPHGPELMKGALARCEQCHVGAKTDGVFRESTFSGLRQDFRHGPRQHGEAPPRIPHRVWMRENCIACHGGEAAREEIRTTHPERARCRQCHLEVRVAEQFAR